jgi:hypothetical protein
MFDFALMKTRGPALPSSPSCSRAATMTTRASAPKATEPDWCRCVNSRTLSLVVSWAASVSGTAREILAGAEAGTDSEGSGALQEATDFLLDLLMDGPKPAKKCKAAAAEAALSWATVRRAQDKLGIKPSKDSMTGGWTWSLPEGAHQKTKVLTPERMSTFGNREHLRGESVVATNDLGDTVTDGWKDEL